MQGLTDFHECYALLEPGYGSSRAGLNASVLLIGHKVSALSRPLKLMRVEGGERIRSQSCEGAAQQATSSRAKLNV